MLGSKQLFHRKDAKIAKRIKVKVIVLFKTKREIFLGVLCALSEQSERAVRFTICSERGQAICFLLNCETKSVMGR